MTWDFAEVNIFSDSVGSTDTVLRTLIAPLEYLPRRSPPGRALQINASEDLQDSRKVIVSTDPP
jgi:putative DNA methylase